MNTTKSQTTVPAKADEVFFDEDCPMCRNLASHYASKRADAPTQFLPLQTEGVAESLGATHDQLMLLMHVRTHDGRVLSGADGVVHLLSRRLWGKPLAALFKLPGAMPLARAAYGLVARNRQTISHVLIRMPWWLPLLWLVTGATLMALVPIFGIIEFLFLLAPMVLVPGIIGVHPTRTAGKDPSIVESVTFLAASLPIALSFTLPKGPLAAALILPWILVATLRTSRWLWQIKQLLNPRSEGWIERITEAVADAFLMVGVGGLATSRLGYPSLGFSEEIILLTAVHFHFSGFITLNLALMAWGKCRAAGRSVAQLAIPGIIGVILSVPFIAIGFFISIPMKVVGVTVLMLAILCLSMLLLTTALLPVCSRTRFFLIVSAFSPGLGMTLSMIYVVGEFVGQEFISIPTMAATHGVLNGVGFCLCGLLGLLSTGEKAAKSS